ncbi:MULTISPECIES: helix-turn-helix domain-containing protein [unclassified Nonomuraea]|uniref:helix-turn-helix transcriptional regulator n=1 Tax=unclassified Nonomuraea TaxID=2593643 RepID=UPI0033E22D00
MSSSEERSTWTFLTHHARVLLEIARDPRARLRDIAASIGITERAVQGIVSDLHQAGYVTRDRIGRRNQYAIDPQRRFRYPTEADLPIGLLIDMFTRHDLRRAGAAPEQTPPVPEARRTSADGPDAPAADQGSLSMA